MILWKRSLEPQKVLETSPQLWAPRRVLAEPRSWGGRVLVTVAPTAESEGEVSVCSGLSWARRAEMLGPRGSFVDVPAL